MPHLQRRFPKLQRIVFDEQVHVLPAELRAAALVQIVERER